MENEVSKYLWVEKYRPHKVADCILPAKLKAQLQKYTDDKNIPNLIFSGRAGVGKTSAAMAMVEESGSQFYKVNASLHGNVDTMRNEIMQFASSVSNNGLRKYVILDEADNMSQAFQQGLRAFMEEFSSVTGFILTCNYKSRIIEPIHSRCPIVDFKVGATDAKDVANALYARLVAILKAEKVEFEKPVLVEVIKRWFPDFRRILGEIQRYSQESGKIDSGLLSNLTEERLKGLLKVMQEKDFTKVRIWVTENSDIEAVELFRTFYEQASHLFSPASIPELVTILARYQYQAAFVADPDINVAACFAEIMATCTWK